MATRRCKTCGGPLKPGQRVYCQPICRTDPSPTDITRATAEIRSTWKRRTFWQRMYGIDRRGPRRVDVPVFNATLFLED